MKNVATKWAVNETLLQSYRMIFISTQSLFIAVGILSLDKSMYLFLLLLCSAMFTMYYIWIPVVNARHKIVDYYKYALDLSKQERANLCSLAIYTSNDEERIKANAILKMQRGKWSPTRIKIDIVIPSLLTFIWIGLLGIKYFS